MKSIYTVLIFMSRLIGSINVTGTVDVTYTLIYCMNASIGS